MNGRHPSAQWGLRRLAIDNLILVVQYAGGGLVALLLIPHVVRHLGLDGYGRIAVALAWAGYANVFVQYAFQLSGPRYMAEAGTAEAERDIWIRIACAKILLLGASVVPLGIVGWIAFSNEPYLLIPLVVFPLAAAANSGWFLQAKGRFGAIAGSATLGAAASLVLGFALVGNGSNTAATVALVLGQLVLGVGTFVAAYRTLGISSQDLGWRSPSRVLSEGAPLVGSQFAASLSSLSGPLVLNAMGEAADAGAFASLERISGAIATIALLTHIAAYPALARLRLNEPTRYFRLLGGVVASYLLITCSILVAVYVFRGKVSGYVFGREAIRYEGLVWFACIWIVIAIFGPAITGYLTLLGRGAEVLRLNMFVLVTSFLLGLPAAWVWGVKGWYVAILLGQAWVVARFLRMWWVDRPRDLTCVATPVGSR